MNFFSYDPPPLAKRAQSYLVALHVSVTSLDYPCRGFSALCPLCYAGRCLERWCPCSEFSRHAL